MRQVSLLDNGLKGKISEAIAASNLMQKGYQVYFGFGNTSCDLIAVSPAGKCIRVEVKTAKYSGYRPASHPDNYDVLMTVDPDTHSVRFYGEYC